MRGSGYAEWLAVVEQQFELSVARAMHCMVNLPREFQGRRYRRCLSALVQTPDSMVALMLSLVASYMSVPCFSSIVRS